MSYAGSGGNGGRRPGDDRSGDAERRVVYWKAWRLSARFGTALDGTEKALVRSILQDYSRESRFDPFAVAMVEQLTEKLFVIVPGLDVVFDRKI